MANLNTFVLIFSVFITTLLQSSSSQRFRPNVSCIARERTALLQFRNSLNINGSNGRLTSWSGEDCCNWEGVGCDKNTGHVVELDLHNVIEDQNGSFQGEINSSLLALKHLNYLDLSMNNFPRIPIPTFFGSLKNLKYLNLSGCGFRGNIPQELGNLSYLQHLDLSYTFLTAESISWVAKLSSLESLDLSTVNLSGSYNWFQAINMLPSLLSLKLNECHLDSLPNHLHVNLTSLRLLDLDWNSLNSILPTWLFNLTSLKYLDLTFNSFHGLIPQEIRQLTSLTSLDLSYNNFNGSLLDSLGSLNSLRYLNLSYNNFGGSLLPLVQPCNLTSLEEIELRNNKFEGSVPTKIGCFRQLVKLDISGNQLTGTIPSNLGLLEKLDRLDISSNSLIGEISQVHFAKLKKLTFLSLSNNSLTLNVSSSWVPPFQAETILMYNVKIGPQFPSWLQTQKKLLVLRMTNSSISSEVPDWLRIVHSHMDFLDLSLNNIRKVPNFLEHISSYQLQKVFHLTTVDLSRNLIVGPIPFPEHLRTSISLKFLYLNDNYFNGSIPESICDLRTLEILDLSNNKLSGRLPLCLGNLRDLVVLKLEKNNLCGQIPSSLGNIGSLQSVVLSQNKLNGKLPESMRYLISLQFLDLGKNELEGIIPSWIGKHLSKLRILSLQSNHFDGDVPVHLCQLSELQVLNLARNNLTGSIPSCFNNFTAMGFNYSYWYGYSFETGINGHEKLLSFMGGRELEYPSNIILLLRSLDLSQNNISGGIPNELMDLVGLQSLKLSRNHLSGNIPEKIGNLNGLTTLDFSMNELSGSIPPSLANLNFLNYLNLSFNELSGRIPTGNQLQTLVDPSIYAGNNGLCGKPLSNNCSYEDPAQENEPRSEHKNDTQSNLLWFYTGLEHGFAVGVLLFFCILLFKKSWCIKYFHFVENFSSNILVWSVFKNSRH